MYMLTRNYTTKQRERSENLLYVVKKKETISIRTTSRIDII